EKSAPLAREQLCGLKEREKAVLDEQFGEGARLIGQTAGLRFQKRGEALLVHQPALADEREQVRGCANAGHRNRILENRPAPPSRPVERVTPFAWLQSHCHIVVIHAALRLQWQHLKLATSLTFANRRTRMPKIRAVCPQCAAVLSLGESAAPGKNVRCPKCQT